MKGGSTFIRFVNRELAVNKIKAALVVISTLPLWP